MRNAFLQSLICLQQPNIFTVQLGLNLLNRRYSLEYQQTMAQSILGLLPVLVVFFVAQRRSVQGIAVTGLKRSGRRARTFPCPRSWPGRGAKAKRRSSLKGAENGVGTPASPVQPASAGFVASARRL